MTFRTFSSLLNRVYFISRESVQSQIGENNINDQRVDVNKMYQFVTLLNYWKDQIKISFAHTLRPGYCPQIRSKIWNGK
jgi:hypothetical protein